MREVSHLGIKGKEIFLQKGDNDIVVKIVISKSRILDGRIEGNKFMVTLEDSDFSLELCFDGKALDKKGNIKKKGEYVISKKVAYNPKKKSLDVQIDEPFVKGSLIMNKKTFKPTWWVSAPHIEMGQSKILASSYSKRMARNNKH